MGFLFITSLVVTFLMGLPTLTYFYAKHLGRNAKKWFIIGLLLPGLATIILSFLPDVKQVSPEENGSDHLKE